MKKISVVLFAILFLSVGCATIRVRAPEKPIKVDITMRLDVYQHVKSDIDAIEDIVKGVDRESKASDDHTFLNYVLSNAYAEGISSSLEDAARRRKGRYDKLISLESSGVVGENNQGLVEVRQGQDVSAPGLVSDENRDRMVIYKGIAKNNGVSVAQIQKIYTERLQSDAPAGTPIQTGGGSWVKK